MKKVYLATIFSMLLLSCNAYKPIVENNLLKSSNTNQLSNIEIIPIMEMEEIPNFSMFKIDHNFKISKDDITSLVEKNKEKIKSIDFVSLSKWAKNQMLNYTLKDNNFTNLSVENVYSNSSNRLVKIKLDSLPSHSPIVIRDLYLYNLYDNNNLKTIYVTIQGHVEE